MLGMTCLLEHTSYHGFYSIRGRIRSRARHQAPISLVCRSSLAW